MQGIREDVRAVAQERLGMAEPFAWIEAALAAIEHDPACVTGLGWARRSFTNRSERCRKSAGDAMGVASRSRNRFTCSGRCSSGMLKQSRSSDRLAQDRVVLGVG